MHTKLLVLCVMLFPSATVAAQGVDSHGHAYRTEFNLHDRAITEFGWAEDGTPTGGVELRLEDDLPFTNEQIWWRLQTRLLSTRISPKGVQGTVAAGSYLRHDVSSHIVIPADPDILIPAPFDVYLEWSIGRATFDGERMQSMQPISGVVGADFCRDPTYRTRCGIGPVVQYRYDVASASHEVVPFTQLEARLLSERRDGRLAGGLSVAAGWSASGEPAALDWRPAVSMKAEGEWLIFAVNDQPVSLFFGGAYDADVTLQLGVRASFGGS